MPSKNSIRFQFRNRRDSWPPPTAPGAPATAPLNPTNVSPWCSINLSFLSPPPPLKSVEIAEELRHAPFRRWLTLALLMSFFCSAVNFFFFLLCNFFLLTFCSIQSHSDLSLQSGAGGACGQLSAGTAEGGVARGSRGGFAGPANRKSRSSSSPRSCHSCNTQAIQMHFYAVDA